DPDAPTGSTIAYPDGFHNTSTVDITTTIGSDVLSGVRDYQLQRSSATLSGGTCGAYGGFTDIGGLNTPATYTDTTIVDGFCYKYRLRVWDNVDNREDVVDAAEVKVDTTKPVGTINALAAYVSGNSVTVTGTASDSGSGVASFDVTRTGAAPNSVCINQTQSSPWTCNWDTTTVADGSYTLTITVRDNATNTSLPVTITTIVDNSKPTVSVDSWVEGLSPQYQHPVGTKLYVNPTSTGTATLKVLANDTGSGVNRVEFPALGSGWSPAALSSDTTGTPTYDLLYSWSPVMVAPTSPQQVRAVDNVSLSDTSNFDVELDGTAPSGSSISVVDQFTKATSSDVTFAVGTDAQSGVEHWQLQRRSSPLSGGVCTGFGPWGDLGAPSPSSPYADATTLDATCYEYRIETYDNVNNVETIAATGQQKIDRTPPSGTITTPTGPYVSGVVSITGTHADAQSAVQRFDLTYSGTSNGTITCNGLQPSPFTCTWSTGGAIADGPYDISLVVTDVANNVSAPILRHVVVDNTAPSIVFDHFTESMNSTFQYEVGNTLFYNPALSGSFDVTMKSLDAGSGVKQVDFPALGAGWTPAAISTDTTAAPVGLYDASYTWNASSATPTDPQTALSTDNVGLTSTAPFHVLPDAAAPVGGAIDYLNTPNGSNAATFDITYTTPNDALSGLQDVQIQRREATYSGAACGAFSPWANVGPLNPTSPWQDVSTLDGMCYEYQLVANDNVANQSAFTAAKQIRVDRTAPTGAWTPFSGPYIGNTVSLSGTASDASSGLTTVGLAADAGSGATTIPGCDPTTVGPNALAPDPDPWSCSWDTTSVSDGPYTLTALIRDAAGNVGTVTITTIVDNTPPSATLAGYVEGTNPQNQFAVADTMWYNPAVTGDFTVQVNNNDTGSGPKQVAFPSAGAGWTLTSAIDGTPPVAPATTWDAQYAWTASPNDPSATPLNAIAADFARNTTSEPDRLRPDSTPPAAAGTFVSYSPGYYKTNSVLVGWTAGADAESGFDHAQLFRRQASLAGDICGAFGAWGPVGPANPAASFTDTTVVTDRCYEYNVTVYDHVNNSTTVFAGGAAGSTI
ncbi:MAG: laminin sub domain 2, partial [Thermoleophilia bacterium]|nr:laminin sub domain 2 [Thermoleophilia bacterium]